jgi:hypothetical protein
VLQPLYNLFDRREYEAELDPHSPDNALSFGVAWAIQI